MFPRSIAAASAALVALSFAVAPAPSVRADEALIIFDSFFSRAELLAARDALQGMLEDAGLTVDTLDSYGPNNGNPGDLSDYECVFDIRADGAIGLIEGGQMVNVLGNGGGLYFAGEHALFAARNNSVAAILTGVGGGPITFDPVGGGIIPGDWIEPTNPDHPLVGGCQPVSEVTWDGVDYGRFLSAGNGTWLTGSPALFGSAAWSEGDLAAAPSGRVVVALDINGLSPSGSGTLDFQLDGVTPTENRAFYQNVIGYLCFASFPLGDCGCNPRNHGYWHRYCLGTDTIDPGRFGRGNGPGPKREHEDFPANLVGLVDGKLAAHDIGACEALDAGPFSDTRLAALRELATLHFNIQVGWLHPSCPVELHPVVDDEGLTVADALQLMEDRLAIGTDEANKEARWIGEHVANGEALLPTE